jgi:hypothetical protein
MGMASEVAAHLAGLGLGVLASSLFVNKLPPSPDVCGAVFDSGGSAPDGGFGVTGIQYENPTVAVWFRGAPNDTEGPRVKSRTAYKELAKVQASAVSGVQYLTLVPIQPPFILPNEVSTDQRTVWCFNCAAQKEVSS